jgi:hypothetical protein
VRNPNTDDGRWKLKGKNQVAYVKTNLSLREQFLAVDKLR